MIRVIATNWRGMEMVDEIFETELEARDFIEVECYCGWDIETKVED